MCNSQDSRAGQVSTVAEVRSSHHVLGIEHLLSQLRNGNGAEGVGATARQWRKANHEEVKTREGNHVDGDLAKVGVQLAGETKTGCDAGHDGGNEMVKIAIRGLRQLESANANVVECLEE